MNGFELLVVGLAVVLGALVKGVTGLGLPLTAVPVIAFFVGVEDAVVIMAAPTAMSNAMLVREHRRELRFAEHLPLFAGLGAVGAVAGAWALPRINERILLLALSLLLGAFLAWRFSSASPRWSPTVQRWGRAPVALTCGVAQGAIGISGPLVAAWFQGLGMCLQHLNILVNRVNADSNLVCHWPVVDTTTMGSGLSRSCGRHGTALWNSHWTSPQPRAVRSLGECGHRCVHGKSSCSSLLRGR